MQNKGCALVLAKLVIVLLLVSPLVFAVGGKTFTWIPPTEREPDAAGVVEPLPNVEIEEYRIYCDGDAVPVWTQTNQPVDTDSWIAPNGTFALGTHVCQATAVDTEGQESDRSNSVNFTVSLERPKAPTLVVQ